MCLDRRSKVRVSYLEVKKQEATYIWGIKRLSNKNQGTADEFRGYKTENKP